MGSTASCYDNNSTAITHFDTFPSVEMTYEECSAASSSSLTVHELHAQIDKQRVETEVLRVRLEEALNRNKKPEVNKRQRVTKSSPTKWCGPKPPSDRFLNHQFKRLDRDNDGWVHPEDQIRLWKRKGIDISRAEVQAEMKEQWRRCSSGKSRVNLEDFKKAALAQYWHEYDRKVERHEVHASDSNTLHSLDISEGHRGDLLERIAAGVKRDVPSSDWQGCVYAVSYEAFRVQSQNQSQNQNEKDQKNK